MGDPGRERLRTLPKVTQLQAGRGSHTSRLARALLCLLELDGVITDLSDCSVPLSAMDKINHTSSPGFCYVAALFNKVGEVWVTALNGSL